MVSSYLVGGPQVLHPDMKLLSLLWQVWVDVGPQHRLLWAPQTLETQHLHQIYSPFNVYMFGKCKNHNLFQPGGLGLHDCG